MNAATARELVELVVSRTGYTSAVGTRVSLAEPGRVHLALDRQGDLLQHAGHFHGGVITGLADTAAGGAVTTLLPPGRIAVTIALDAHFLAPADGDRIIARATALRVGRTVSAASVDVTSCGDGEARVCALCVVTLRAVAMPGAA